MTLKISNQFAEVIESSLHGFKAQCWQWNTPPAFGSLIAIENEKRTIFGIVYAVEMGSMDPVRYPFPYQKTEAELLSEQPQIFAFLKTTFSCLMLGFREKERMHYLITPEPPKIHAFVGHPSAELIRELFANHRYLHLLFGFAQHISNIDELLLAILRHQAELNVLTKPRFQQFIETFSLLSGNDYRRLKLFLQRAEPFFE